MNLRPAIRFCLALAIVIMVTSVAHGDTFTYSNTNPNTNAFIYYYRNGDPSDIMMVTAKANGADDPVLPNISYYATTIMADETLSFDWSINPSTFDWSLGEGYILNGVQHVLGGSYPLGPLYGWVSLDLLAGDSFAFFVNSSDIGQEAFSVHFTSTPTPTPEPGTLLLLGTGLAGFAGAVRRRLTA